MLAAAHDKLRELEQGAPKSALVEPMAPAPAQVDLFTAPKPHPALEALEALEPDALTPRQALDVLYKLRAKLKN